MDYFCRAENGVLGNALKDGMFSWDSSVFGEIWNPTYFMHTKRNVIFLTTLKMPLKYLTWNLHIFMITLYCFLAEPKSEESSDEDEEKMGAGELTFLLQLKLYLNHLHPNISMHILHTVLCTFPKVLARRICLTIKKLCWLWSFLLFL